MDPSWDGLHDEVIHSLVFEEYADGGSKLFRNIAKNTPIYTLRTFKPLLVTLWVSQNFARY
jgi:hypothetical protein